MDAITALLDRAGKSQQQGLFNEAEHLYHQIIETAPSFPELWRVWHLLGTLYQTQDRKVEAVGSLCRSLQLKPDSGSTHNALGIALASCGKHAEAEQHFRRALELTGPSAGAYGNIANSLLAQAKFADAEQFLRLAVQTQPGEPTLHIRLAYALAEQQKLDLALSAFQEAGRLAPDAPLVHGVWGSFLIALARFDEAVARLHEALRLDPKSAQAWGCLGELAKEDRYQFPVAELDQLRTLVADESRPIADLITLRFVLGTILDKAGRYDEAFEHFRGGNELKEQKLQREGRAFDAAAHWRFVEALVAAYTPEHFRRCAGFGSPSQKPIFIVGMPRSGTTLVSQILSAHPRMAAAGELSDVQIMVQELSRQAGTRSVAEHLAGLDAHRVQSLAARYLERLERFGADKLRVIDKTPENYFHLGLIATLFPRACLIHCRRDPADTCFSCYTTNFKDIRFATRLSNLAEYHHAYEKLMEHWRSVLPLSIHEVRYEHLINEPEAGQRDLVAYCGLEWDESCTRFYEKRDAVYTSSRIQVRRPIYRHALQRWRPYANQLGEMLAAFNSGPSAADQTTPAS